MTVAITVSSSSTCSSSSVSLFRSSLPSTWSLQGRLRSAILKPVGLPKLLKVHLTRKSGRLLIVAKKNLFFPRPMTRMATTTMKVSTVSSVLCRPAISLSHRTKRASFGTQNQRQLDRQRQTEGQYQRKIDSHSPKGPASFHDEFPSRHFLRSECT